MDEMTRQTPNEITPQPAQPPAQPAAQVYNPVAVFNPDVFKNLLSVAEIMAKSDAAVPAWLRGNPGGCFSICISAMQWGMNPFGLASDSFCIEGGTVSFGAKSTHAIVEKVCGDSFEHEFQGDWDKILGVVEEKISQKNGKKYYVPSWKHADENGLAVSVWLPSDPGRKLTLKLTQCLVRNSTNWASNPQLQLFYQACKVWARMYKPGAMLGVYSVDEMSERETVDVTPRKPHHGKTEELKAKLGVPDKLSARIAADIESRGLPVTFTEVEAYLKSKGVADIDDDAAWPKGWREKFSADVSASLDKIAAELVDKLI